MSNKVKLYDKNGAFVKRSDAFKNKVDELTALNKVGLFVSAQFNKGRTELMFTYDGFQIVTKEKFNNPFKDSK